MPFHQNMVFIQQQSGRIDPQFVIAPHGLESMLAGGSSPTHFPYYAASPDGGYSPLTPLSPPSPYLSPGLNNEKSISGGGPNWRFLPFPPAPHAADVASAHKTPSRPRTSNDNSDIDQLFKGRGAHVRNLFGEDNGPRSGAGLAFPPAPHAADVASAHKTPSRPRTSNDGSDLFSKVRGPAEERVRKLFGEDNGLSRTMGAGGGASLDLHRKASAGAGDVPYEFGKIRDGGNKVELSEHRLDKAKDAAKQYIRDEQRKGDKSSIVKAFYATMKAKGLSTKGLVFDWDQMVEDIDGAEKRGRMKGYNAWKIDATGKIKMNKDDKNIFDHTVETLVHEGIHSNVKDKSTGKSVSVGVDHVAVGVLGDRFESIREQLGPKQGQLAQAKQAYDEHKVHVPKHLQVGARGGVYYQGHGQVGGSHRNYVNPQQAAAILNSTVSGTYQSSGVANGRTVFTGARGGQYVLNPGGSKRYI